MRISYSAVDRADDGFRCACFFHFGDRQLALGILFTAVDAMSVQTLGFKNKLDSSRRQVRKNGKGVKIKKLSLRGPQLLQYLILMESAEVEQEQEATADPNLREEDFLIRYIKHAVVEAWRKLSLHMAVALWRVIHKYEMKHLSSVEEFLAGEPGVSFSDDCRRSKMELMNSLHERFGKRLEPVSMQGKENRFREKEWTSHQALIAQCLRLLTPWETPCLIHDEAGVPVFALNGRRQRTRDPEQVERNRIHSHVHPDCFELLTRINRLPGPESMLDLPKFTLSENSGSGEPPAGERPLPHLTDDEIAEVKRRLAAQAARRRAGSPGLLKVVVDGKYCASVDLSESRSLTFQIGRGAEWLKVYGRDGAEDILLASHLMDDDEDGNLEAAHAMVRLPRWKQIEVSVSPDPVGGGASVTVVYRVGVFSSLLTAARWTASSRMTATRLVPAVVLAILALVGAAIFVIRRDLPKHPAPIAKTPQRQPAIPSQAPPKPEEPDAQSRVLASIVVIPYSLAGEPSRVERIPDGPGRVELQFSIPAGETRFTSYRVIVKNGAETAADTIAGHKTIALDGKQYRVVPALIPAGFQKEERLEARVSGRSAGGEEELLEVYSLTLARRPAR